MFRGNGERASNRSRSSSSRFRDHACRRVDPLVGNVARVACCCRDAPGLRRCTPVALQRVGDPPRGCGRSAEVTGRLVAAWASEPTTDTTGGTRRTVCTVFTRNGSEEPVRNVTVTVYERVGDARGSLQVRDTVSYPVLAPQTSQSSRSISFGREVYFTSLGFPVSISFRDSQGYSWLREPNGTLRLLAGPPSFRKPRRPMTDRPDPWPESQTDQSEA
jgi:hypothetical protein